MLAFFRKIRKGIVDKDSANRPATESRQPTGVAGRYFLYAIGEVTLVVIGILIALQINNWNEYKKDRVTERKVLQEIYENIALNCNRFRRYAEGVKRYDEKSDIVIAILNGEQEYSDTLDKILNTAIQRRQTLDYAKVGYESLKNVGFEIIQNDTLQKGIRGLFEETYPRMMKSFNWASPDGTQPEYLDHHFLPISGDRNLIWKPYNFEVQMKDNYFKTLIHKIKIQRNFYKLSVNQALSNSESVLQHLKEELENSD